MSFKIEINNDKEVRIYNTENNATTPFFLQPTWPDGTPWTDKAEAQNWASVLVESWENPKSEFIAGTSPDNHPRLRPEPVKIDPDTGEPIEPTDTNA